MSRPVAQAPPARRLVAGGGVRRRKIANRLVEGSWLVASGGAVAVLAVVTISVLLKGIPALNLDLLTKTQEVFGQSGGGIEHALIGTLILIGLATTFALPVGVLAAIYVSELADRRVAHAIRLALDVLNGLPSIVIGIFVFTLIVVGRGQSGWAGAIALAIVMLPLVARATQEVLALVPKQLREASLALGVSRWRTIVSVVLPTTLSGILTGTSLAIARAAGETAPLLFTSTLFATQSVTTDPGKALASIPVVIFEYSEAPDRSLNDQAWAAAFLLIAFVLVTSLLSRALLARTRRRLEGR